MAVSDVGFPFFAQMRHRFSELMHIWTFPIICYFKQNTMFWKLSMFVLMCKCGEATTQLGALERAHKRQLLQIDDKTLTTKTSGQILKLIM